MKKMVRFLAMTASAAMLFGCAQVATSKHTIAVKTIEDSSNSRLVAVGPAQMVVLGPVFYIQDSKQCSKLDLLMAASKKYPNMSDVINVEMEETDEQRNMVHNYSCKYYGLAVSYAPLTKETIENIKALEGSQSAPKAAVQPVAEFHGEVNYAPSTENANVSGEY